MRALAADLRAITALQILNSVLSAASASVLFAILKNALGAIYLSVCMTLLFAFSATWWKFSTDANAYVPSVLFLLVCFYLVLPDRKPRPLLIAVVFASAGRALELNGEWPARTAVYCSSQSLNAVGRSAERSGKG